MESPRQAQGRGPRRDRSAISTPSPRRKLKKELLDALDAQVHLRAAAELVEQEFAAIWSQVEADMKNANKTFADEDTTEDEARAEYRKIAERRVRLGLVLAEIGEQGRYQGFRRRGDAGSRRAGPPVPGPGEAGLGVLPEEPAGPGRDPRADLRGEGRRPHPRAGEGGRRDRSRRRSCSATTRTRPRRTARSRRRAPRRKGGKIMASKSE